MNLVELFKTQKALDNRIVKEKGLEGKDLLPEKILALLTELGELSNEWRGFKFWSEDREPRTVEHKFERNVDSLGNVEPLRNPMLEEYVDCLHFILSIGNDLDITNAVIDSDYTEETATGTFNALFESIGDLNHAIKNGDISTLVIVYEVAFNLFIGLGEKHLDFTRKQIEAAYYVKNKVNHSRQENNY